MAAAFLIGCLGRALPGLLVCLACLWQEMLPAMMVMLLQVPNTCRSPFLTKTWNSRDNTSSSLQARPLCPAFNGDGEKVEKLRPCPKEPEKHPVHNTHPQSLWETWLPSRSLWPLCFPAPPTIPAMSSLVKVSEWWVAAWLQCQLKLSC